MGFFLRCCFVEQKVRHCVFAASCEAMLLNVQPGMLAWHVAILVCFVKAVLCVGVVCVGLRNP